MSDEFDAIDQPCEIRIEPLESSIDGDVDFGIDNSPDGIRIGYDHYGILIVNGYVDPEGIRHDHIRLSYEEAKHFHEILGFYLKEFTR